MSNYFCTFGHKLQHMAKVQFKSYNQGQTTLFPSDLGENIAADNPVRLISRIVDGLNLDKLIDTYKEFGCPSYHPRMLLKVVFYAYMNNVYSCRNIEQAMWHDIYYMWLSGNQHPSFNTINRFRSEHVKDVITDLFVQVVRHLVGAGVLSLDVQYIDGTKMESVANKYTFVWKKTVERNKEKLEKKIRSVLLQIDEGIAQDYAEAAVKEAVSIDSASLKQIVDKINEANSKLPSETKEQCKYKKVREKTAKELTKMQEKEAEYEGHLAKMGDRNSYSKTDQDATFMHMKEDAMNNGQLKPGYNVQIGTNNQYITQIGFYPNPTDTLTMPDFLESYKKDYGSYPHKVVADSGYGSEENYEFMETGEIEAFVKYNYFHKEQHRPFKNDIARQENLYYNEEKDFFVCPMGQHMERRRTSRRTNSNGYTSHITYYEAANCKGCPLRSVCMKKEEGNRIIGVNHQLRHYKREATERLTSEEGLAHRSRRPIEPEAVFGQMKHNKHYKRFRHKGKDKVKMDFTLFAIAFNLQKYARRAA